MRPHLRFLKTGYIHVCVTDLSVHASQNNVWVTNLSITSHRLRVLSSWCYRIASNITLELYWSPGQIPTQVSSICHHVKSYCFTMKCTIKRLFWVIRYRLQLLWTFSPFLQYSSSSSLTQPDILQDGLRPSVMNSWFHMKNKTGYHQLRNASFTIQ